MSNDLFTYPRKMPKYLEKVPMYETTRHKTFSPNNSAVLREINARVTNFSRLFGAKTEQQDTGDIILYREEDFSLEIYKASDSVWWTHNELAYQEKVPSGKKLPDERTAAAAAGRYLRKYRLNNKYAKKISVDYIEMSMSRGVRSTSRLVKTEAQVIYGFSLEGLPVMGPGAKIKVSLVEDGKMSSLLYFWRNLIKKKAMKLIHPEEALERLSNDPRFMRLSADKAVVKFEKVLFGYYALPPDEFQRYLVPVYAVSGIWSTEFLQNYAFTYYIVAVQMTPDQIKEAGIVADPNSCQVF